MKKLISLSAFLLFLTFQFIFNDCTAQWTQTNYNLWGKHISTFAVSGDTIFAGINYSNNGIMMSTNGGVNWIQTSLTTYYVYSIVVAGNNIYAACSYYGLYLSTNRGANWTNITNGLYYPRCVALSGNTIFVGCTYDNGVFLSTNNGVNWIQTSLNNRNILSLIASGNNVIASTDGYGIFFSSNNGISWSQSSIGSGRFYTIVQSGSTFYAGGEQYGSGISKSTNNGVNWTEIGFNASVYSLAFSGSNLFAGTNNAGVYYTTNNGTNWTQTTLNNKYIPSLCVNGNTVFAGTQNGYYTTTNNGLTWDIPPPSSINAITQSGSNLIAGTSDGVFYSSNGGLRWTYKNLQPNTISLLLNGSYIFSGTAGSGVYYTTNDGVNWTQTSMNNQTVNSLVIKGSNIIAATSTNGVYYTTNNGTNWTQSSLTGITTKALYVLDSIVYAGTVFGGVYKSTNDGVTWSQTSLLYIDVNSFIYQGGKLYAGTGGSGVYYTTNNGANWTQTSFNTNTIISFSNYGSTIFAGTSGSGVYMTKNAGVNWTQVNDGMGNQWIGSLFTFGNYEIAGTGSSFWRRYILEFAPIRGDANLDSTVNVLDVTSTVNYILGNPPVPFSTLAADVNTDLLINVLDVVGEVNIILHPGFKAFANKEFTDNSGSASLYIQNNNLKLQNTVPVSGIQFKLTGAGAQNVTFTPSSTLTNYQVAGGSGSENAKTFVIFTMSDTSINAGVHTLGTFSGLNSGFAMNEIFIADGNGNGVITSNEENGNTEIPKDYSLNQNYPNPFNSSSKLKFEIANLGYTKLVLYDVMGREVQTLVDKTLKPGAYEITFDGSMLSSGVYFYKLTSGNYIATKKMIVLK